MPAHNEADNLGLTVQNLVSALEKESIEYEIVIVNDHSTDGIANVAATLQKANPRCRLVENTDRPGYGMAVRCGLDHYTGDAVAIVMADASEDPDDIVKYYRVLQSGYECAFGTRFSRESLVIGYPIHKLILNRIVNFAIRTLFFIKYNDVTNAFKSYRRQVIDGVRPLLSPHFNLTVELPLKAIVRGYTYKVVPINWRGQQKGVSKLKIVEMGSRYAFIILYVWLEKMLSRGDYRHREC